MNFYNIDFEVKYNDIYNELLDKYAFNQLENSDYDKEDITTICTNLYQHELIQVFYASSLLDSKIDNGIQRVFNEILSKYQPFTTILNRVKKYLFTYNEDVQLNNEQKQNLENNSSYFLLLMLFSENLLYITHKCICQLTKRETIELPLLVNLESLLEETLRNRF
jgi:hypothetical protein